MEATGAYDRPLRQALQTEGGAHARVNPGGARDFARAAGFLAETDQVDARMLQVLGQALRPRTEPPADPARQRLAALRPVARPAGACAPAGTHAAEGLRGRRRDRGRHQRPSGMAGRCGEGARPQDRRVRRRRIRRIGLVAPHVGLHVPRRQHTYLAAEARQRPRPMARRPQPHHTRRKALEEPQQLCALQLAPHHYGPSRIHSVDLDTDLPDPGRPCQRSSRMAPSGWSPDDPTLAHRDTVTGALHPSRHAPLFGLDPPSAQRPTGWRRTRGVPPIKFDTPPAGRTQADDKSGKGRRLAPAHGHILPAFPQSGLQAAPNAREAKCRRSRSSFWRCCRA